MSAPRVHVVGAGLAGLSAAVALAGRGHPAIVHEAASFAGGRCRSYFDRELKCRLDNGNHLLLSGNAATLSYLEAIGARDSLTGPSRPDFHFVDLATREHWALRLSNGRAPWWICDRTRRVPATRPRDYLAPLRLAKARPDARIAEVMDTGNPLFRRLWEPFAVAALNTEVEAASARALYTMLQATFGRGGGACRPLVPRSGLSESLVDPAVSHLAHRGAWLGFNRRLRAMAFEGARVRQLDFGDDRVELGGQDQVILAVPPLIAGALIPGLSHPLASRGILNIHYRATAPANAPAILGLVGGLAQWVFRKHEVISVTVSAADGHFDAPAEGLAARAWDDIVHAHAVLGVGGPASAEPPPWRIVKEKRATFAATPEDMARRPGHATGWTNLFLAGDWTDTGLAATIEGAVSSGQRAALAAQSTLETP